MIDPEVHGEELTELKVANAQITLLTQLWSELMDAGYPNGARLVRLKLESLKAAQV